MTYNTTPDNKRRATFLFFFICTITLAFSQVPVASISYTAEKDSIRFNIRNNTQDTIYLFDSYITDGIYSSYLRQYQKHTGCILSLLPLWPYLSVSEYLDDLIILNDSRVVRKGQIPFHATSINPMDSIVFYIHKSVLWIDEPYTAFGDSQPNGFSCRITPPGKPFSYKELTTKQLSTTDIRSQIKFRKLCKEQHCDQTTVKLAIFTTNPRKYLIEGYGFTFPDDRPAYITIDCVIQKF